MWLEGLNVALQLNNGGGWRICVVRMQDIGGARTHNSTIWQALTATLSVSVDYPKIVIAVDEDIDLRDLESVFWAVAFRYRYMPHRDTKIIQGRKATLDQSSAPYTLYTQQMRYPTSLEVLKGRQPFSWMRHGNGIIRLLLCPNSNTWNGLGRSGMN